MGSFAAAGRGRACGQDDGSHRHAICSPKTLVSSDFNYYECNFPFKHPASHMKVQRVGRPWSLHNCATLVHRKGVHSLICRDHSRKHCRRVSNVKVQCFGGKILSNFFQR
jgi:hypothetical protein